MSNISGRRLKRLAAICCSMSLLLGASNAMAQQIAAAIDSKTGSGPAAAAGTKSAAPRSEPSMEEMLSIIKRLEDRVRELEARAAPIAAPAVDSAKPAAITTAAAPTPVNAVKIQDAKKEDEEKKANDGILGFFRATEITGFVDAYYGYNFNRPTIDTQLRNFDTKHNQFSLNMAEIALEKKPTPDNRLGYRMDLDFGPATDIVHSFEPGGLGTFRNLEQGYLSYLAPAGKGLQIDVGKFVTQHGAEVIETKDNWNYSRSLLFALAIPYYHFGVRATYPVADKLSLSGYVVNGWNNVVDNNHRKTYGAQAVIKPNSKFTFVQNYMGGPEQTGNDKDWRHLSDSLATYTVNSNVSLMVNYDYGFDRFAGARVHWQGIAGYAKFQVNKWYAFSPRFEWYDDHDGFTTGVAQKVKDITLTSEHKINNGLITRLEYRRDFSDKHFFTKGSDLLVKAQTTLAFGLVYAFSSKSDQ